MQQAELGLNQGTKRTRKREFLAQMERVVPWAKLEALIALYAPEGRGGRPSFAVGTMVRIHFRAAVVHAERPGNGRSDA